MSFILLAPDREVSSYLMSQWGEIPLGKILLILYVASMHSNIVTMTVPSLFKTTNDAQRSTVLYKQLHSRSTIFKRVLHIIFFALSVYLILLLIYQFQSYLEQQHESQTAFGKADDRYHLYQQMTQLAAQQWSQLQHLPQDSHMGFLASWVAIPNVKALAIYSINGSEQLRIPEDIDLKSILTHPGHHVITSANYFVDDKPLGYVVVVVDDASFRAHYSKRITDMLDKLFSSLVLGIIAGIYLTRSGLKLLYKLRENSDK
ncbi:hypothetical protein DRW07_12275 [Alteromonas sediminis]|uniref:Uncharacterized protein n=1 Tax=Alteromonas sediminis TaxID=2259342 RepID=A0A3N5XZU2_9ALTE|nr:hypothetical protein [Alteromonas sediminis]RPJ65596.1 hypothetical protein DRW07_12275 [Alteromonas sediminis]